MSFKETAFVLPLSTTARQLIQQAVYTVTVSKPPPEGEFTEPLFILNEWIQYHHSAGSDVTIELMYLNIWDFVYRRYEGALEDPNVPTDNPAEWDPVCTLADFIHAVTCTIYPLLHTEVLQIARYLYHLNTDIEIIDHPSKQFVVAVGYPQCN